MRWKSKVNSIIFILVITGIAAANLVWMESGTVSEKENRPLAPFPTITFENLRSGEFSKQFTLFINDRFPGRGVLTDIGFRIEDLRGIPARNNSELVTLQEGDRFAAAHPVPEGPDPSEEPDAVQDGGAVDGTETAPVETDESNAPPTPEKIVNQVLLLENRGMEILDWKMDFGAYYAKSVLGFLSSLPDTVPAYAVLVPSHIAFLDVKGFENFGPEQQAGIARFYSLLGERVTPVDAFGALETHKGEYIYFRTDHHWTALGAYYAYRRFIEAAGMEPVPLDAYDANYVENFIGSMYLYTLDKRLADNPDTVEYYVPFVEHEYHTYWDDVEKEKPIIDLSYETDQNKYQIFISSDQQLGVIKNKVESERKLLIFKDSYGNAFVPFLMPHYREIHIIDPRYYQHNAVQYFKEHDIDDVLFINYFGVVASAGGYAFNLQRVVEMPSEKDR